MAAEVPNAAAFAAAVNAPVPQDQPVPYTGRWADTAHEQTPAGIDAAMDRWTPVIEAELTRVNGRITDLNTEVDDTAERCNGLTDRLTSLEFRTGAAVAEGANQVAQTAEAVIQTAAFSRHVAAVVEQNRNGFQPGGHGCAGPVCPDGGQ